MLKEKKQDLIHKRITKRPKAITQTVRLEPNDEDDNEPKFIYLVLGRVENNPFYTHGWLGNQEVKFLIDMGVDLSIIPS